MGTVVDLDPVGIRGGQEQGPPQGCWAGLRMPQPSCTAASPERVESWCKASKSRDVPKQIAAYGGVLLLGTLSDSFGATFLSFLLPSH